MSNKKSYQAPEISVFEVFIEQSFAAGSQVALHIENSNGLIESEWQKESLAVEIDW